MSNTGTSEAEQSLNTPKSDEELADAILTAVSEGNDEEMSRLLTVEITPDVEQEEEEDSEQDSEDESAEESDKEPDDQHTASSEEESRTTAQTQPTAEDRIAKLEQELANAKALAGRTPALQSRLAQLENQLKKQLAANKQKEPEVSPEDKELADRIARLKEIDPDTAAILEALQKRAAAPVSPKTAQVDDGPDNEALQQEYYKLLEVHHDAGEIFNHPYWHQWKGMLKPEQREWAESTDHQKVAVALTEFKKFMAAGPGAAPVVQQPVQREDVVDATKVAREKKLQRSADTPDKPVKKRAVFDKDAEFMEAWEKAAKEAGVSY